MKSKDHSIAIPEKKISMAEIAVMADVRSQLFHAS